MKVVWLFYIKVGSVYQLIYISYAHASIIFNLGLFFIPDAYNLGPGEYVIEE